jgi:hypothetical protein
MPDTLFKGAEHSSIHRGLCQSLYDVEQKPQLELCVPLPIRFPITITVRDGTVTLKGSQKYKYILQYKNFEDLSYWLPKNKKNTGNVP